MAPLKRATHSILGRIGYRVIRQDVDSPCVPYRNFSDLAHAYEYRREGSGLEPPIPQREGRLILLADLAGTPPAEAYEIIAMLAATADVDGDVCEFGIAQGSTSALIANEIRPSQKTLHLFDSFEGLSRPTEEDGLRDDIESLGTMAAYEGAMANGMKSVLSKLSAIAVDDDRYVIHAGFVQDTLTSSTKLPRSVSFAYLDMDLFEPTSLTLEWLDTVTPSGAVIVVDDYDFFSTGVKTAVDRFVQNDGNRDRYDLTVPDTRLGRFAILRKQAPS